MKNKIIGVIAAICVLFANTGMTAQAAFADSNSTNTWNWAWKHIDWAEEKGIVAGKADNCFDADGLVTRAEAATMMVKLKGIDASQYDTTCERFEDVADDKWYTKYINAAYENELVAGKTETLFDPDGELTRAEAAAMIVGVMDYELDTEMESPFMDIEDGWYTDYINTAYIHEIVVGKEEGVFDPNATVSRAEIATMLHATTYEDYEIGLFEDVTIFYGLSDYTLTSSTGTSLNYISEEHKWDGILFYAVRLFNTTLGHSYSIMHEDVRNSEYFEFEPKYTKSDIAFIGDEMVSVTIAGSNIDKVRVYSDGTICLYGTDMEYNVIMINQAHRLEYSETEADDVVLKVVDKQLVEITE